MLHTHIVEFHHHIVAMVEQRIRVLNVYFDVADIPHADQISFGHVLYVEQILMLSPIIR